MLRWGVLSIPALDLRCAGPVPRHSSERAALLGRAEATVCKG